MKREITLTSDLVYEGGATLTDQGIELDDGTVIVDAGNYNVIIKGQIRSAMAEKRNTRVTKTPMGIRPVRTDTKSPDVDTRPVKSGCMCTCCRH